MDLKLKPKMSLLSGFKLKLDTDYPKTYEELLAIADKLGEVSIEKPWVGYDHRAEILLFERSWGFIKLRHEANTRQEALDICIQKAQYVLALIKQIDYESIT